MRSIEWKLFGCLSLLACGGRYDVGTESVASAGGLAGKSGGDGAAPTAPHAGTRASGGEQAMGFGGAAAMAGGGWAPLAVDGVATFCGVPAGQPAEIPTPITNYMMWWFRVQVLIWGGAHEPPAALPFTISYEDAEQIVDDAIEQAIAETGGIPGATRFVKDWLQIDEQPLVADWAALLAEDEPALAALLTHSFDAQRIGAFCEESFLTSFPGISQRGNRMHAALFNQQIPAEPPSRLPVAPMAGLTRRENMELMLEEPTCFGCHVVMDPPGFALEHFDELGRYRTTDAGKPVDTSGAFSVMYSDGEVEFAGIQDLGSQLETTCAVNLGFADRFLVYALQSSDVAAPELEGIHALDRERMRQTFLRSGRSYRALVKEYARGPTLRTF